MICSAQKDPLFFVTAKDPIDTVLYCTRRTLVSPNCTGDAGVTGWLQVDLKSRRGAITVVGCREACSRVQVTKTCGLMRNIRLLHVKDEIQDKGSHGSKSLCSRRNYFLSLEL